LDRNAVIGANRYSGTTLHQSVLNRLGAALGNGAIWLTEKGQAKRGHFNAKVMGVSVVIQVSESGEAYKIFSRVG